MNSFVRKLYLYRFLNGFMFIFPLYSVMFQDAGLSPFQISILIVVWAGTSFLLQVPSGALADKYSRKKILILAQFAKAAGFFMWMIVPTFEGFLIGFVLWGIQGAFQSGTFEAILYDELHIKGKKEDFTKIYGRTRTADFTGFIAASALATPLFAIGGYVFIIVASIIMIAGSVAVLLSLPNIKNKESTHETEYFHLLKNGFKIVARTPLLLRMILFLSIVMSLSNPIDEYYGIFVRQAGVSTANLGVFMAIAGAADVAGSLLAHRYKKYKNSVFYILFISTGIILLASSILFNIFGLIILLSYGFFDRIIKTVFEGKIQDEIPDGIRATISSVNGFSREIGTIAFIFMFGYVAEQTSVRGGFYLISGIVIATGVVYLVQRFVRVNILHLRDHHLTQQMLAKSGIKKDNIVIDVEVGPPQDIQIP